MRPEECGFQIDQTCGAAYCPRIPGKEPEDDQSWEECCEQCRAEGVAWQESMAELRRDQ